jgi:hypothetical protein
MATGVTITPHHEGKREHAREIVRKLESHLGHKSVESDRGHRFDFDDDDAERHAADFSGALDQIAPDWRNHVEMGL